MRIIYAGVIMTFVPVPTSSSANSSHPAASGRLNNPRGAWCFTSNLFSRISFVVDLVC